MLSKILVSIWSSTGRPKQQQRKQRDGYPCLLFGNLILIELQTGRLGLSLAAVLQAPFQAELLQLKMMNARFGRGYTCVARCAA